MVGVAPENAKLRERARRNVVLASGRAEEDVDAALAAAGGDARVALVSLLAGVDPATARERLEGAGGSVGLALRGASMRLEVQAALVRGELVPGDVEVEDGVVVDVGLPTTARGSVAVPGFVDLQVNGFARRRLPLGLDRRLRPRGQRAPRGRRHRVPADVHHRARVRDARRAARDARERLVAARRRRARRRARSSRRSVSARIRASTGAIPTSSCSTGSSTPAASPN